MILESNRIVSTWLGTTNGTSGVNALLPSTPLDAGDVTPAAVATITDETRDGDVARGDLPAMLPAVAVSVDVIEDLDGQVVTVTRDGRVKLRIRVAVENATTEAAVRDLSYYVRTVQRSLRLLMAEGLTSNAARLRNNVYLESILDMKVAIVWTKDQAGGATVAGYVFPTIQLRDLAP